MSKRSVNLSLVAAAGLLLAGPLGCGTGRYEERLEETVNRLCKQSVFRGRHPPVEVPGTPAVMIQEVLPCVDMVLVMTVNPGFGGQKFIVETLGKIRTIRDMITSLGLDIDVQVDGGVTVETAPLVVEHGANVLVAGTSVFSAPEGIAASIAALRQSVAQR